MTHLAFAGLILLKGIVILALMWVVGMILGIAIAMCCMLCEWLEDHPRRDPFYRLGLWLIRRRLTRVGRGNYWPLQRGQMDSEVSNSTFCRIHDEGMRKAYHYIKGNSNDTYYW